MDSSGEKPHINVDFFEDLTGEISNNTAKSAVEDIGKRIKGIREQRGLSIEDISKLTGFDVTMIENMENSEVRPQLGVIIKLSKALDSAFGKLVAGPGNQQYSITRKEQQKNLAGYTALKNRRRVYTYVSLAPQVEGRRMEPLTVQLEDISCQETIVHDGEEFIYVLDGIVALEVGEEYFELKKGDTAYYKSSIPHKIGSKGGRAEILAVMYEGDL